MSAKAMAADIPGCHQKPLVRQRTTTPGFLYAEMRRNCVNHAARRSNTQPPWWFAIDGPHCTHMEGYANQSMPPRHRESNYGWDQTVGAACASLVSTSRSSDGRLQMRTLNLFSLRPPLIFESFKRRAEETTAKARSVAYNVIHIVGVGMSLRAKLSGLETPGPTPCEASAWRGWIVG